MTWRSSRRIAPFQIVFVLALTGCHASPRPAVGGPTPLAVSGVVQLQHDIGAVLAAPALARGYWGVLVKSLKRGDTLYALNADRLLMPGSVLKVVTLAAAAERLGWDHTYETRLVAAGPIDSGVLNGDLLVIGSGDPSIVESDGMASRLFASWADTLKSSGVRAITGRIIGDDNAFDDEAFGPGWAWDDLPGRDAAGISGLQYNENTVQATIAPGAAVGAPASVTLIPDGSRLEADNQLTTDTAGATPSIAAHRSPGSNRLELRGSVPLATAPIVRLMSVDNPTLFFVTALRNALTTHGIEVRGEAADIDELATPPSPDGGTVLVTYRSPPLSTLAIRLMKFSQNLYAETLLKTLGASAGTPTLETGRTLAGAAVQPWGVAPAGLIQVDGSGLSRYNYVTPEALVAILTHVDGDQRLRDPFEAALPIAGRDGTLAARMKGTAAEGNARAKSGTLANVRSLAGYVASADGEPLVFAIVGNNFGTTPQVALDAIDAIVVKLAQFKR